MHEDALVWVLFDVLEVEAQLRVGVGHREGELHLGVNLNRVPRRCRIGRCTRRSACRKRSFPAWCWRSACRLCSGRPCASRCCAFRPGPCCGRWFSSRRKIARFVWWSLLGWICRQCFFYCCGFCSKTTASSPGCWCRFKLAGRTRIRWPLWRGSNSRTQSLSRIGDRLEIGAEIRRNRLGRSRLRFCICWSFGGFELFVYCWFLAFLGWRIKDWSFFVFRF